VDENGDEVPIVAESPRAAAEILAKLLREARIAQPSQQSVRERAKKWLEARKPHLDSRTHEHYEDVVLPHINAAIGDLIPAKLTIEDLQGWINCALADEYSPHTIRGWVARLKTMMSDWGITFPWRRLKLDLGPKRKKPRLNEEETVRVLARLKKHRPNPWALIAFMDETGLRFTHASAIRFEDIDEAAGVIHVRRKNVMGEPGEISRTKNAPEQIPYTAEVKAIVQAHRAYLLRRQHRGLAAGWLFPSRTGGLRLNTSSIKTAWAWALREERIDRWVSPHGIRRAWRDRLRRSNVDRDVAKKLGGWSTDQMAEEYGDVSVDEMRAAMERAAEQRQNVVRLKTATEGGTSPQLPAEKVKGA
jgi:integrase